MLSEPLECLPESVTSLDVAGTYPSTGLVCSDDIARVVYACPPGERAGYSSCLALHMRLRYISCEIVHVRPFPRIKGCIVAKKNLEET